MQHDLIHLVCTWSLMLFQCILLTGMSYNYLECDHYFHHHYRWFFFTIMHMKLIFSALFRILTWSYTSSSIREGPFHSFILHIFSLLSCHPVTLSFFHSVLPHHATWHWQYLPIVLSLCPFSLINSFFHSPVLRLVTNHASILFHLPPSSMSLLSCNPPPLSLSSSTPHLYQKTLPKAIKFSCILTCKQHFSVPGVVLWLVEQWNRDCHIYLQAANDSINYMFLESIEDAMCVYVEHNGHTIFMQKSTPPTSFLALVSCKVVFSVHSISALLYSCIYC